MTIAQATLLNVEKDRNGVVTNIRELLRATGEEMALVQPDRSRLHRSPCYRLIRTAVDRLHRRMAGAVAGDIAFLAHLALRVIELRSVMANVRSDIKIIHAHDVISAMTAIQMLPGAAVVLSCHFWTMPYHEFSRAGLVRPRRFAWRLIRAISLRVLRNQELRRICLSHAAARKLQRLLRLPEEPAVVYPPTGAGVQARRKVERDVARPYRICVVGTIEQRKMQRRVPEISAYLAEMGQSAEFLLVGFDANEEGEFIRRRIREFRQESRVRLLGALPPAEVDHILCDSDMYLQLSPNESFGIGVIEAARSSLPIMAVRYPALEEILGANAQGIVSRRSTEKEIASKIDLWLKSPEMLAVLSREMREIYVKKFQNERFVQDHVELYSRLRRVSSEIVTK